MIDKSFNDYLRSTYAIARYKYIKARVEHEYNALIPIVYSMKIARCDYVLQVNNLTLDIYQKLSAEFNLFIKEMRIAK